MCQPYIEITTVLSDYCITGRAIQENIQFVIDHIGPTEGKDNTEVENGILTSATLFARAITSVSIGMGNNERAIKGNIAL